MTGRYGREAAKAVVEVLGRAREDALRGNHVVPVIVRVSSDRSTVTVEVHPSGSPTQVGTLTHSNGLSRLDIQQFGVTVISRALGETAAAWLYVGPEIPFRVRRGTALAMAVEVRPTGDHTPDDCSLCEALRGVEVTP